jgi:hypothetical protein
MYRT